MEMVEEKVSKYKVFFLIGMIVVLSVIFIASSQTYEQQDMRPFLGDLLNTPYLMDKLSSIEFVYAGNVVSVEHVGVAGFIEFFIRKAAHFTVFGLLGFFTCGVLCTILKKGRIVSVLVSLYFVIVYACLDELHQKITGGRSPLLEDIIIDTLGGFCGIMIFIIILYFKTRKSQTSRTFRS